MLIQVFFPKLGCITIRVYCNYVIVISMNYINKVYVFYENQVNNWIVE